MSEPIRVAERDDVPIRVSVLGGSQACRVAPFGGPPADRTYSHWLRDSLTDLGTAIDLQLFSDEGVGIDRAIDRWQEGVQRQNPDVVIVQFGAWEAATAAVPRRVAARVRRLDRHAGPKELLWRAVRSRLDGPFRSYQRAVDRVLGLRGGRMSPARFEAELRTFTSLALRVNRPLVLCVDLLPPGGQVLADMPSAAARTEVLRERLASTVASFDDPHVRLVDLRAAIEASMSLADALPDGRHLSAAAHRVAAATLLREISSWEATGALEDDHDTRIPVAGTA